MCRAFSRVGEVRIQQPNRLTETSVLILLPSIDRYQPARLASETQQFRQQGLAAGHRSGECLPPHRLAWRAFAFESDVHGLR
jgi:hypothetical protein